MPLLQFATTATNFHQVDPAALKLGDGQAAFNFRFKPKPQPDPPPKQLLFRNFQLNQRLISIRNLNIIRWPLLPLRLPVFAPNTPFNVFPDRVTPNAFWYLPEYEFVFPDKAFFDIISDHSFDSRNVELFKCVTTIQYDEIITPDRQAHFDALKAAPGCTLTKIPLSITSADLVINYQNGNAHYSIAGTMNADGTVSFSFGDDEQFSAAQLAYRNIADPDHTGSFAQVIFYGTFNAYSKVQGVATADQDYVMQHITYSSDPAKVSVPCNTLGGTLYNLTKDSVVSVIGCLAPWSAQAASGSLFREIITTFDGARVFQSYIQPEFFFVVPTQYYIDRDDTDNFRPSVDVIAMLNPDEDPLSKAQNIIVLNFYVKPALTSYDIAMLEQTLLAYCPATASGKIFPLIKFPGSLQYSLAPSNFFDAEADEGVLYAATDKGYNLRFILSNPLDLAKAGSLIPATLKSPAGYIRKVTFSLDDKTNVDSIISLSFYNTTGDVLDCSLDKTNSNVVITNKSPLTVTITDLLFYNDGKPGYAVCNLAQPTVLTGNQQAVIQADQASLGSDITAAFTTYSNLEAAYTILENADDNLTESRIVSSYLKKAIVLSTNIDPAQHNILKIVVNARIVIVNIDQLNVTMTPDNGVFSDFPQFNLTLPLNDDLAKPENQVMNYTVQFYYNDGTMSETGDKTLNFGTEPVLFIAVADIPVAQS